MISIGPENEWAFVIWKLILWTRALLLYGMMLVKRLTSAE